MTRPLGVQLYSLREEIKKEGFPSILNFVAECGYNGVEFAGLHGLKAADVRKMLDDRGLRASSAHVPAFDPAKTQQVIDDAKTLGHDVVGSGFGPKDFENEASIKVAADRVNAAVERLGAAGLRLELHNHWWEWENPRKGELLFKLCPKLLAQFDIYWMATAGADPVKLVRRFAERVRSVHVKDGPCVKGEPHTAVGKGKVNIPAVLEAAERTRCEWYIVELDSCATDMKTAVRESARYLAGTGFVALRLKPAAAAPLASLPSPQGEVF